MCRFDSRLFITDRAINVCIGEGLIYCIPVETSEASKIIPDMITALAARFIILYEVHMTSTFSGFERGFIFSADHNVQVMHLASLEHCEYSSLSAPIST